MPVDLKEQYNRIYRYCYIRVHNRELAEDLTQETFLRFLEHPEYKNSSEPLKYLYTIAKNLCIDEYRKKTVDAIPENYSDEQHDTEEELIENILLKQSISSLSEIDREIILLRYVNDVPISVISSMYNMSRFALYRKIKSILSRLRLDFERSDS